MTTIKEVAEHAGVSQATVSRVMNQDPRVAHAKRSSVLAAVEALGYKPNAFARSLASSKSSSIGLVLSDITGPYFDRLLRGVERSLRNAHKHLVIASAATESEEAQAIEFLISRGVDGLLLHIDRLADDALVDLSKRLPIVLINRHVEALPERCIYLDQARASYVATQYLIDQGHRQLACISGPLWQQDAAQRLRGFHTCIAANGMTVPAEAVVEGDFCEASGSYGIDVLLQRKVQYTALVAGNDDMACGAMVRLRELGYQLPGDVSIVGFDNAPFGRYSVPMLSSVHVPVDEMGEAAIARLLHEVYRLEPPDVKTFEAILVRRDSVARSRCLI